MRAVHCRRHRCSHSPVLYTGAVTVTSPSGLPGGILIVVHVNVDHRHGSSFISPFIRLVVLLSAGALFPASCHLPFVQLIVMLSAGASSSTSHWAPCPLMPPLDLPLVCQLVVTSPLLSCHHLLSFSPHATSALQRAAASCPPVLPVASCLLAGCHVASRLAASTLHHLPLRRRLTCPSLTPHLNSHQLVVASHLVALPLPSVLLSTPLPLNVPPHYVAPATTPHVHLSFAPTGC
jgi:hypothetical protein